MGVGVNSENGVMVDVGDGTGVEVTPTIKSGVLVAESDGKKTSVGGTLGSEGLT